MRTVGEMEGKICNVCGALKLLDEFYLRRYKDRVAPYGHCKACHKQMTNSWRDAHPQDVSNINQLASKNYLQKHGPRELTPSQIAAKQKRERAEREVLSDRYVMRKLRLPRQLIPDDLIEMKRGQLAVSRAIRVLKHETKEISK